MVYATRRKFLHTGLISGVTLASTTRNVWSANVNNEVNLGFIGCGGRGNILMTAFSKVPGVTIGGLCDPDKDRLEKAKERFPKAQTWADLRDLLDDPSIDAVVIATCNHWHCLAAIWAMEAGKDVYVEKPLSHSQWEGEQTVAAAEKNKSYLPTRDTTAFRPHAGPCKEISPRRTRSGEDPFSPSESNWNAIINRETCHTTPNCQRD
jgi:hypothetical protein